MEDINFITAFRIKHGYHTNLPKYIQKTRTNTHKILKAEQFFAKHMLIRDKKRASRRQLKKALRHAIPFSLYHKYIHAIYMRQNDSNASVSMLSELRSTCILNTVFVEEVDLQLRACGVVVSCEKVRMDWNGIVLEFMSVDERDAFERGCVVPGAGYHSLVCNYIIKYVKLKNEVDAVLQNEMKQTNLNEKKISSNKTFTYKIDNLKTDMNKTDTNKTDNIKINTSTDNNKNGLKKSKVVFCKLKKLVELLDSFILFLKNNFTENEFLNNEKKAFKNLLSFFNNLVKYENCDIKVLDDILNFCIPERLVEYINIINKYRENRKISYTKARRIILGYVEKELEPVDCKIKMPFLPVYYDVAFNFIDYPKEAEKSSGGLFRRFSFFGNKK
ncbi:hypothetical protein COBT_000884 [Conglomerata obtusa]